MTSIDTNQNTTHKPTLDEKNIDTSNNLTIVNDSKRVNNNANNKALAGLKQNYFSLDLDKLNKSSVNKSNSDNVNNEIVDNDDNLTSKMTNDEDGNLIDLTQLHNDINSITSKLINLNDCFVSNDKLNLEKVIIIIFSI